MAKKNQNQPHLAGVDDYPERPYEYDEKADEPRKQVDQIPDYLDRFPTLDTSGPEHDPEVQAELQAGIPLPDPQAADPEPDKN